MVSLCTGKRQCAFDFIEVKPGQGQGTSFTDGTVAISPVTGTTFSTTEQATLVTDGLAKFNGGSTSPDDPKTRQDDPEGMMANTGGGFSTGNIQQGGATPKITTTPTTNGGNGGGTSGGGTSGGTNGAGTSSIEHCYSNNGNCEQICKHKDNDPTKESSCDCEVGYKLEADNHSCRLVDLKAVQEKCSVDNGWCDQTCEDNTSGIGVTCTCGKGYVLSKNLKACDDVNECQDSQPCDQICDNNFGSFTCRCIYGFQLDPTGLKCVDMDECATDNGGCEFECMNLPGTFKCGEGTGMNDIVQYILLGAILILVSVGALSYLVIKLRSNSESSDMKQRPPPDLDNYFYDPPREPPRLNRYEMYDDDDRYSGYSAYPQSQASRGRLYARNQRMYLP